MDKKRDSLNAHDKLVIWLQQNVARDRWKYDGAFHHIPKVTRNTAAVKKLNALVTQCDADFVKYRCKQHEQDHMPHTGTTVTLTAGQADTEGTEETQPL